METGRRKQVPSEHDNILGSDKIFWHRYVETYEQVFSRYSGEINILEFGTFRGDSVRYFLDRFPEASVISVDILEQSDTWPKDKRVKYVRLDQGSRAQLSELFREQGKHMDLVVEDGSHHPGHQRDCLLESLSYLEKGSVYIVEDIHTSKEQLRNFGLIAPSRGGFIDDNGINGFANLLRHSVVVRLVSRRLSRRPKPKVNLLTLLLGIERRRALGQKLSETEVHQLSQDGFFTLAEVRTLDERIQSVKLFGRIGLPLSCHVCSSQNFELSLLRCECGTRVYKDDDSMAAILEF
jgi:hypothetical protein